MFLFIVFDVDKLKVFRHLQLISQSLGKRIIDNRVDVLSGEDNLENKPDTALSVSQIFY